MKKLLLYLFSFCLIFILNFQYTFSYELRSEIKNKIDLRLEKVYTKISNKNLKSQVSIYKKLKTRLNILKIKYKNEKKIELISYIYDEIKKKYSKVFKEYALEKSNNIKKIQKKLIFNNNIKNDIISEGNGNDIPNISVYNMDNLNDDIIFQKKEGEIYGNFIQLNSKTERFDKKLFINFFNKIKDLKLKDAKDSFSKDDLNESENEILLSPFYPTCCAFKYYLTVKEFKNGLFGILAGGNGGTDYNFYYITTYKNYLVEFNFNSNFYLRITDEGLRMFYLKKELSKLTIDEGNNFMKKLFFKEKNDENYDFELKKVKEKIKNLYIEGFEK